MKLVINERKFKIDFNDLNKETQIRLYRECPEIFCKLAAKSSYSEVRKMAAVDRSKQNLDSDILEGMLLKERALDIAENIWYNPNLKKTDDLRRKLIKSSKRLIIAKDVETPNEILNEILINEALGVYHDGMQAVCAIDNNPSFKMNEKTRKILLSKTRRYMTFDIAVNDEGTLPEELNKILKKELKDRKAGYTSAVSIILNSPNFIFDKESKEIWENSKYKKECERRAARRRKRETEL